jgi:hypothetical protein
MTRKSTLAAALAAVLAVVPGLAAAQVFTYSGFLKRPNGTPETSATTLNFKLWGSPTGGATPAWAEADAVTPGSDGYFSVVLGATAPLSGVDFSAPLWLELQVAGEVPMVPRVPLTDAPRAVSVPFSGVSGFPASTCLLGSVANGIGNDGRVTCAPMPSPRSTGWRQAATPDWGFNWGAGSNEFAAPGDVGINVFYASVTALTPAEAQHGAISVYVDCSHGPATAAGVPQCKGAQQVPFTRHVVNGANSFDLEFRYVFDTNASYAQWLTLVVALKSSSGTWDAAAGGYMQTTYLPNLKFRGMVVPSQY